MNEIKLAPEISTLYRLPFSKNDNPNGWIEITTHCNMECPLCYRGIGRDDFMPEHRNLENIKDEIIELERLRNCQIISISGGEPLMHPDIYDVVRFIRKRKMLPFIQTNGLLLNKNKIKELRQAGLAGLVIRVDSLSINRTKNESDLNSRRSKLAELVATVKGIHLTFLSVINKDNLEEIPAIIEWALENNKLIDFIALIPQREVLFDEFDTLDTSKWVYLEDLCRAVKKKLPDIEYASYLGSQLESASIKWLQAPYLVINNSVLGYTSPGFVEFFQMTHHLMKGKYAYKFGKGRSKIYFPTVIFLSLFFRAFRKIAINYLKHIFRNPLTIFKPGYLQLLTFIIPPGIVDGQRDLCDGCPDAILFNGRLVPSCGLEEIKKLGYSYKIPELAYHDQHQDSHNNL